MGNSKTKEQEPVNVQSPVQQAEKESVAVRNIVPKMKIQHVLINRNEKPSSEFAPWELLDQIDGAVSRKSFSISNLPLQNSKVRTRVFNHMIPRVKNLEEVEIVCCGLDCVPPTMPPQSLQVLKLMENTIPEIPSFIQDYQQIMYIDMSSNKLTRIPSEIGVLRNLQFLILAKNQISKIADGVFDDLGSLKDLNLQMNQIEQLTFDLKGLRGLEQINLSSNLIRLLPKRFYSADCPVYKFKIFNNPLTLIETGIQQLRSLTLLDVRQTQIQRLPYDLCRCRKLKILNIQGLELKYPPSWTLNETAENILKFMEENPEPIMKDLYEYDYSEDESPIQSPKGQKAQKDTQFKSQENSTQKEQSSDDSFNIDTHVSTVQDPPTSAPSPMAGIFANIGKAQEVGQVIQSMKKQKQSAGKPSKYRLHKNEYMKILDHLSGDLRECIYQIHQDESDYYRVLSSLQCVMYYIREFEAVRYSKGIYEISALSPYFISRISEIPSCLRLFTRIGFRLIDKTYEGMYYVITHKSAQAVPFNKFKKDLEEYIADLKDLADRNRYVPDFDFF